MHLEGSEGYRGVQEYWRDRSGRRYLLGTEGEIEVHGYWETRVEENICGYRGAKVRTGVFGRPE